MASRHPPRLRPRHVGIPRTVIVTGFGLARRGFNGKYDLDRTAGTSAGPGNPETADFVWRRRKGSYLGLQIIPSSLRLVAAAATGAATAADPGCSDGGRVAAGVAASVHRRRWGGAASAAMADATRGWAITSTNGLEARQTSLGTTPAGDYDGGVRVRLHFRSPSAIGSLAFPAPKADLLTCHTALLSHGDVLMLATAGGERVPAVHVKVPNARHTILYSHGNAEDLCLILEDVQQLAAATGASVFAYDYVGYSTSRLEGDAPSEAGCYRAIHAAWDHLVASARLHPSEIVLYGRSIGSGPTTELAASERCRGSIAGMVLESAICSAGSAVLGTGRLVRALSFADIFVNRAKIGRVAQPVCLMHGTVDGVVPFANGRQLHRLCADPAEPLWVCGAGHNDMPRDRCSRHVRAFLDRLPGPDGIISSTAPGPGRDGDGDDEYGSCAIS